MRRTVLLALASVALLAGCSRSGSDPAAPTTTEDPSVTYRPSDGSGTPPDFDSALAGLRTALAAAAGDACGISSLVRDDFDDLPQPTSAEQASALAGFVADTLDAAAQTALDETGNKLRLAAATTRTQAQAGGYDPALLASRGQATTVFDEPAFGQAVGAFLAKADSNCPADG